MMRSRPVTVTAASARGLSLGGSEEDAGNESDDDKDDEDDEDDADEEDDDEETGGLSHPGPSEAHMSSVIAVVLW